MGMFRVVLIACALCIPYLAGETVIADMVSSSCEAPVVRLQL